MASILGKLGMKAAEALSGIIGAIISWILNKAKEAVGWVSQNLWALVLGVEGVAFYVHGHEKAMLFPSWKRHSVFQLPQNSSNSDHAQSDECQLSVVLFITQGVKVAQYWFSK